MRTIFLIGVIMVAACRQKSEPAPEPPPPPVAHADAIAVAVVADAVQAPDAAADAVVDAAPDDADHTFDLFNRETIGPLRPGAPETLVLRELGPPKSREKAQMEGATGDYVSTWEWPHASLVMAAGKARGPFTVRSVSISGPETWETRQHIHVGSTRADVERAYTLSDDDDGKKRDSFLAGSMYGGLLFSFDHDKVVGISLGPFAF